MCAHNKSQNFEEILKVVNSKININKEREAYSLHYTTLRNILFQHLKEDELFAALSNGQKLTGSYADNLKVGLPDEFDMIFLLKLPESKHLIVTKATGVPGHVLIDVSKVLDKILPQNQHYRAFKNLVKWTDEKYKKYLVVEKLQSWLQGCFQTAINKMNREIVVNGIPSTLSYSRQGPAHTIAIEGKYKYSVDFVPAIQLSGIHSIIAGQEQNWEAIPKPRQAPTTQFRIAYHVEENRLIRDKNNLKNCLRLLKKFRDSHQNMSNLKSYFIKTMFLCKCREESNGYWNNNLGVIMMDMFKTLEESLYRETLPFFWDKRLNLFAEVKGNKANQMYIYVKSVREKLFEVHKEKALTTTQINKVFEVFLKKEEQNGCRSLFMDLEKLKI